MPTAVAYRYTKAKRMAAVPRKDSEIKALYGDLLARLTLRTLAEAFDATSPDIVTGIVFNGYVSTKKPWSLMNGATHGMTSTTFLPSGVEVPAR